MLPLTATHSGQQRIGSERFNPAPHLMHYDDDDTPDHEYQQVVTQYTRYTSQKNHKFRPRDYEKKTSDCIIGSKM